MSTVYLNGQFLPDDQAKISPLDRGFTYGDGVYEWIRAYHGKPFLLEEHLARLASSCAKMRIGLHVTPLEEVVLRLLKDNSLTGDAAIYLQVTRGTAPRSHVFPPADTKPTVFGMAWAFTPNPAFADPGAIAILEPDVRWSRCDIKVTSLIPNSFSAQRAKELGAHEGLFVRDGVVQEGSLSNVFAVFDGEVRTAPLSNYILPGITRGRAGPVPRARHPVPRDARVRHRAGGRGRAVPHQHAVRGGERGLPRGAQASAGPAGHGAAGAAVPRSGGTRMPVAGPAPRAGDPTQRTSR